MKNRRWTLEQKQVIVRMFNENDRRWKDTAEAAGISQGLLRYWLADENINTDKEYARELRSRFKVRPVSKYAPRDPFPTGVKMSSVDNPDELLRENKDLRKKIAYLEDKIAYLTELYKIISEEPEKISKKNDSLPCSDLSKTDTRT